MLKTFTLTFFLVFILAFLCSAALTYFWNSVFKGLNRIDWGVSFALSMILAIVIAIVQTKKRS